MRKLHYFLKTALYVSMLSFIFCFTTGDKAFLKVFASIMVTLGISGAVFAPFIIFNMVKFHCPFCSKKVKFLRRHYGKRANPPMHFLCPDCGEVKVSGYVVGKLKIEKLEESQTFSTSSQAKEATKLPIMTNTRGIIRAITFKEYIKVFPVSLGVPLFFWTIVCLEWNNATFGSRITGVTIVSMLQVLLLIPAYLYFPRKINTTNIKRVGKPKRSYNFAGLPVHKIKVKTLRKDKIIRVMID